MVMLSANQEISFDVEVDFW